MRCKLFIILSVMLMVLALASCQKPDPTPDPVLTPIPTVAPTPPPKTAADFINEGATHMRSGQFIDARFAYSQALALDESQVDAYIELAKVHMELGDKAQALETLDDALALNISPEQKKEFRQLWWETLMTKGEADSDALNTEDSDKLVALATLAADMACYLSAEEITKDDLLQALHAYYSGDPAELSYPVDAYDEEAGVTTLSAAKANMLIYQAFATDIPNMDQNCEYKDGAVICEGGLYFIKSGKELPALAIAESVYLGEDTYYLVFNADGGATHDYIRLLVKRANTPLGFAVISKLQDQSGSVMQDGWAVPTT